MAQYGILIKRYGRPKKCPYYRQVDCSQPGLYLRKAIVLRVLVSSTILQWPLSVWSRAPAAHKTVAGGMLQGLYFVSSYSERSSQDTVAPKTNEVNPRKLWCQRG